MTVQEFEGKNEQEAINKAIEALGLKREEIDVEIVESKKSGFLFGSGKVKIRVHMEDDRRSQEAPLQPESDFEREIVSFLYGLIERIGLRARVRVSFREGKKLGLDIDTEDSGILIGKRGITLEALQLLTNIVAGRKENGDIRVVVDAQNYRMRRERSLIRVAKATAEQVRRTGESRLLEAMNPFERRLVHTELAKSNDIETASEGEGLYKRIRIQRKSQASSR